MKAGDKYKKIYPFMSWTNTYESFSGFASEVITEEGWRGGCDRHTEDGPAVCEGQCIQEEFFTCDAEGFIEYEVLAIADMPRKYQDRVVYRITMIDPDGKERKSNKAHMVTMNKFLSWVDSVHSSYPWDYEVTD